MSKDKRYPAFLLILAVFLGFFLFTSNTFHKDPPEEALSRSAALNAPEVPGLKQAKAKPSARTALPVFPIDINKASVQELMLLPGIGEKTAQRIVEKRTELKGFKSIDDLTAVKWVGKVKLEKIRGLVTVSQPAKGQSGQ